MITAEVHRKVVTDRNSLGELVYSFEKVAEIDGFLDLISGDRSNLQNAEIEQSSHLFVTFDFEKELTINDQLVYNGKFYEITFVDNPMELNDHLEVYLKAVA